ncbi:hypothetical protein [Chiayiivirga flava]|uniref:Polymer-forming cytoskeletal protein n=1 Tax=Chiayiivirga flava TaxID=659595 RepID=A0A7W8D6A5_9GAMM|nr:hypothetical protein [Chiayiivirga flava]MBB5207511.1 hypothetical protein [Chiayiivirga flava]
MTIRFRKSLLATALLAAAGGASAAITLNDGLDGTWANAAESGRGVALDVIPGADGSAIVSGGIFSYDADGNPVWMTFAGSIGAGESAVDGVALNLFEGGSFGAPFTAPGAPVQAGTAAIVFDSCTAMTVDLDMTEASGLDDVTLELEPTQTLIGGSANPLCSSVAELAQCPDGTTADGDACALPNSITGALHLPAGKVYTLQGEVAVEDGATLTIDPGVTVRGSDDTSALNYLAVKRGGRLYAEGTATQPIVFTGPDDVIGSWGGLVIAGNSTCNDGTDTDACEFEANPAITYGGTDLNDSSGALRYVRVQYAGIAISEDSEFNSITLLGVGAGTVLDHVQVDSGKDDGFEMFGGSVNGRYLVCSNMGDDCFDFDQGYTGKIQFALGLQGENTDLGDDSNGIESDNDGDNNDKLPRTQPQISNLTLVGKPELTRHAMRLRRGTGGNYTSVVMTSYTEECLELGDTGTFAQGTASEQGETLSMTHTFIGTCTGGEFKDDASDAYLVSDWFAAGEGNESGGDPMLDGFLPMPGSPVLEGGAANADAFFRPTSYRGAFAEGENWTAGWTVNLGN